MSDGTKIATASDNNLITIWDSVKSKQLRKIRGHTDGVRDLIQLQNGKLASNSSIEIIIWNLFSGKPILIIKNPGNFCCILEAASNILVAGGESGITFWKLGSLEIGATRVLKSIQQGCTSIVCIRYQGIACAAGTQIYVYRYYHPLTWENDNTILQHTNPVYALVFLDKSNTLISGDTGGIIRIWSLDYLDKIVKFITLTEHTDTVRSLIVTDCRTLISSSDDGNVKFWNLDAAKCVKTIEVKGVRGMNVTNGALMTCGDDRSMGYMRVWLLSK